MSDSETLELPVSRIYLQMLETIEEERTGDTRTDLARSVEDIIHQNYQQVAGEK